MPILTDSKIRGLKPKNSAYYAWHDTGTRGTGRVGIKVYPSGRKVFVYKYHQDGARKFASLGDYPETTLANALSMPASDIIANKSNPSIASRTGTVRELFKDYFESRRRGGSRSLSSAEYRVEQVFKSGHINPDSPANEVTPYQLRLCLSDFIQRGAIDSANRTLSTLAAGFQFGMHADNNPAVMSNDIRYGIMTNPAAPIPPQDIATSPGDRFLQWGELGMLLNELNRPAQHAIFPPDVARALLLCIHTGGQRPYEIVANPVTAYDRENRVLTISPGISKTKNFHAVPLTNSAIEIIESQLKAHPKAVMIFPGLTEKTDHLLTRVLWEWLNRYCVKTDTQLFNPRDLRRTFKTLAAALGMSLELRDRIQNHKIRGVSSHHYDRYQYLAEKRAGLEIWEKKISQL